MSSRGSYLGTWARRLLAAPVVAALAFASAVPASEGAPRAGDGGKVAPMEITPAHNEAARFAFEQGIFHTHVADKCGKLPEPTRSRAKAALAAWRERNQFLVTPTFFWFNYVIARDDLRGNQASEQLLATMQAYQASAKAQVMAELPGRKPTAQACAAQLDRFDDPSLDLKVSAHAPALQAIREYSYLFSERIAAPAAGADTDQAH